MNILIMNIYIYMFPEMLNSFSGIFCFIKEAFQKIHWKLCTKIFSLITGNCRDCKSHYTYSYAGQLRHVSYRVLKQAEFSRFLWISNTISLTMVTGKR